MKTREMTHEALQFFEVRLDEGNLNYQELIMAVGDWASDHLDDDCIVHAITLRNLDLEGEGQLQAEIIASHMWGGRIK